MKLKPLILFASLLFSAISFGQTFNWEDKEFKPNTTRHITILHELDKAPLQNDSLNYLTLDTIVKFLKRNPSLKIEIDNYTAIPFNGTRIDWYRAYLTADTLIKLGIDSVRLVPKGLGTSRKAIDRMTTKADKEFAYNGYKRTEIRILNYSHEFKWTDTVVEVGALKDIRVTYQLGNVKLRYDSSNYRILDTIVKFLKRNPTLKVEIDNHVDKIDPRCCSRISQERAESIRDTLVKLGISPDHITAKGWGVTRPVISQKEIDKLQTPEEKEKASALNRKTEIVIIGK
jgi:outer membrane protein OmpA-like peptidoglycan-associated protein